MKNIELAEQVSEINKNREISICFVTDENYAKYAGVTINSIIKNNSTNNFLHFYILHTDLTTKTTKNLQKILKNTSADFINLSKYKEKYDILPQKVKHITKTSYYKFLIADILQNLDKVLYLDCDIVVQNSLNELFNIDVSDYLFGAVEDVGYTYYLKSNDSFKLKFKCINSGVMLINCEKWRCEKLSEQLFSNAVNPELCGFGQDQPVFNYTCKDRIKFLDFKWNVQNTFMNKSKEIIDREDYKKAINDPDFYSILHYTYIDKPWNVPTIQMADNFWKYYMQTPFCKFADLKFYFSQVVMPTYIRKFKNKTLKMFGLKKVKNA